MSNLLVLNLLIQTNPVVRYFLRIFHKDPFRGIYQANGFDLSILIPYFTILGILSIYGLHRYYLTFLYLRNRNKAPRPLERFDSLPRVTVQLPIYNERYVAERLLDSVTRIDYPREQLEIQVLDDSIDETRIICSQLVAEYARAGVPISYCHRENREGFKAGALAEGLKKAAGEFIAIFDADFAPPPSILRDMVHYFTDPQVAVVQGRWTWINRHTSNLTEVEAIMLDGHFVIEHGARNFSGRFFNFNGTAGMWRRSAIVDAGGWQHDTLTEDTDLSYRAQLKGWKFKYLQDVECPAELPIEMTAFKTQQARWAKGLIQTGKKILPQVFKSKVPFRVKVEAFYHLTANLSYPLMIELSTLLLPAMIIRSFGGWFHMLVIDLPLFMASTFSISSFYLVSQKELFPRRWPRTFLYLPFLMAMGIGLTLTNTRAVIEALLGIKSSFKRTPKYAVQSKA